MAASGDSVAATGALLVAPSTAARIQSVQNGHTRRAATSQMSLVKLTILSTCTRRVGPVSVTSRKPRSTSSCPSTLWSRS